MNPTYRNICMMVALAFFAATPILHAEETKTSKAIEIFKTLGREVSDRFVFLEQADAGMFFNMNGGGNYGIAKSPVFNVDKIGMMTLDFGHLKNVDNSDGSMCGNTTIRFDRVLTHYLPNVTDKIYQWTPDVTHGFMRHLWVSGTLSYADQKDTEAAKWLYGPSVGLFWQF